MSYYDVAAGMSQSGLNTTVTTLFASSTAQTKIFNGNVTQDLGTYGSVNLVYKIVDCPAVNLTPPDQAAWDASYKATGVTTLPATNVFQLTLNDVSATVTYAGAKLAAEGKIIAYATFALANGVLTLTPLAVWIDESKFSSLDTVIVNDILIPQILKVVTSTLSSIPLPQLPSFAGLVFQTPIAAIIDNDAIVLATATGTTPVVDLSGYVSPAENVYVLANIRLLNSVLASQVQGKSKSANDRSGPDGWYAAARISATVGTVQVAIDGSNSLINLGLTDISGYGELGGAGVGIAKAVMCPIGAAADAISNPSDWDKVISNFSLTYSPDPLPLPFSLKAATSQTAQTLSLSIGKLGAFNLVAAPQWSGSVTGTVLAAAAAGFVDLLSEVFGKLIINAVLEGNAQNISICTIPKISTSVEGITVQLTIPDGSVAAVHGTSELIQTFSVQFPQ